MKAILGLIFACFLLNACLGGTIDPNNHSDAYIEYAQGFPFVAKITGTDTEDKPFSASAVAHKDNIIITAAHVVDKSKECYIKINNKVLKLNKIIKHEKYETRNFGYYDIAVARTSDSMGLKWYPNLYAEKNEIKKICSLSGYGMTGDFSTGAVKDDSKQRAGSNIIDAVDRGLLICSPGGERKTTLEFLIASGDSGGGLFIDNRLAGIHSCVIGFGKSSNSEYGSLSGHTRISDHIDWLNDTISKLENNNK
jgi:hypothetical protein